MEFEHGTVFVQLFKKVQNIIKKKKDFFFSSAIIAIFLTLRKGKLFF